MPQKFAFLWHNFFCSALFFLNSFKNAPKEDSGKAWGIRGVLGFLKRKLRTNFFATMPQNAFEYGNLSDIIYLTEKVWY
jgi:hypothetical protein